MEQAATPASTGDKLHAANFSTCVLVILTIVWSLGGHHLALRHPFLTEGSAACLLGLATGLLLLLFHRTLTWGVVTQLLEFNAAGFFTYLLPPVIFYCGLSVEKALFFANLPSILLSGVVGTLVSSLLIATFLYGILGFTTFELTDCLAMGAIFAATDSVATLTVLDRHTFPSLFSLVFGEGIINDATSVVLLGAIQGLEQERERAAAAAAKGGGGGGGSMSGWAMAGILGLRFVYLMATSLGLGGGAGLGIALLLKKLPLAGPHQEVAVVGLLSYLSYLAADVAGWSGILALFTCGLTVSHYALHNLSPEGRGVTLGAFRVAAYLAEGLIFIYVGMDAMDPMKWKASYAWEAVWLVLVLCALLAASRAAFVVPFAAAHNTWAREKLSNRDTVIIWWAGLMRGAVSVALVYYYFDDAPGEVADRQRATLIVATLLVVVISILGCGALTKPLLSRLLEADPGAPLLTHLAELPHSLRHARSRSWGGSSHSALYMAPLAAAAAAASAAAEEGSSHGGHASDSGSLGGGGGGGWPSSNSLVGVAATSQPAAAAPEGSTGNESSSRRRGTPQRRSPVLLAPGSRQQQRRQQQQQTAGNAGGGGWTDPLAGQQAPGPPGAITPQGATAAGGAGARVEGGGGVGSAGQMALLAPPPAATVGSGILLDLEGNGGGSSTPAQGAPGAAGGAAGGMTEEEEIKSLFPGGSSGVGNGGQSAVLQMWSNFDQRVMQPVFGGPAQAAPGGSNTNTPTQAAGAPGGVAFGSSPAAAARGGPGSAAPSPLRQQQQPQPQPQQQQQPPGPTWADVDGG